MVLNILPLVSTRVRLDTSSGIGTGITGEVTVGGSGTVTSLGINTGGRYFAVGDVVTLYDHSEVGGAARCRYTIHRNDRKC